MDNAVEAGFSRKHASGVIFKVGFLEKSKSQQQRRTLSSSSKQQHYKQVNEITVMTDRRPDDLEEPGAKRLKTESKTDPETNPYLQHMYEPMEENGYGYNKYGNGYGGVSGPLAKFERHNTTAKQAHKAEDGPQNPFTNQNLTSQYFRILKTRRDLPVHKQRYVALSLSLS